MIWVLSREGSYGSSHVVCAADHSKTAYWGRVRLQVQVLRDQGAFGSLRFQHFPFTRYLVRVPLLSSL